MTLAGSPLIDLQCVLDERGSLIVGEVDCHVPFPIRRFFVVTDVPAGELRGAHAHKDQHQMLVCLKGSVQVSLESGRDDWAVTLDGPTKGLHIPPGIWAEQTYSGPDAVLLVLCDAAYDEADYIRDHAAFLDWAQQER
ncbi:MAG: sugar 3,4-ketoisomerase [Rhodospirillales bacterium]